MFFADVLGKYAYAYLTRNKKKWPETIALMSLKDGDVLVIKSERHLSSEDAERMRKQFQQVTQLNTTKCVVLGGGLDIEVLRKQ